jgi:hypothetical protein
MKKVSTSIILSLLSLCLFSQNYKLLPDSCTYCFYDGTGSFSGNYSTYYSIEEFSHTSINGYTYTHCAKGEGNNLYGYFRQVGNKVYGISNNSVQDGLVLSFDENIGDTIYNLMSFEGPLGTWSYNAIVLDKDSLLMDDGSFHTYLRLSPDSVDQSNGSDIVWQEKGLCYSNNFTNVNALAGGLIYNFGPHVILDAAFYYNPVNCSSDTLIPPITTNHGHTCDLCLAVPEMVDYINEKQQTSYTVYPNPTQYQVQITLLDPLAQLNNLSYEITDSQGRIILQNPDFSINSSIDLSSLSRGVYLLSIRSEGKTLGTERIVLEK